MQKAKDMLLPALRQHRHNIGDGFIAAYEYDEANEIVSNLIAELEALKAKLEGGVRVAVPFGESPNATLILDDGVEI